MPLTGELAALTGVTTQTIRHYHRIGALPEADRLPNGDRCHGLRDTVRLTDTATRPDRPEP